MKKKLLLIAYRAWGDWIYSLPAVSQLCKDYDVYLETNIKVANLVHNDPRFKEISIFVYEKYPREEWPKRFTKRWKERIEQVKPDRVINLNGSLEVDCIAENFQEEFTWSLEERRNYFGKKAFYDAVFERCKLPIPSEPKLDELYYDDKEIEIVENWRKIEQDWFLIYIPIAGSTSQKVIHPIRNWIKILLERYPKAKIYLAGDDKCKDLASQLVGPRIKNACGTQVPIKQNFLMAKYMDYVLGPETGIIVAAGMWGTPKTMLCTTSNIYQCTKYQKNDHSIQSPLYCSPCHRAIYYESDCHTMLGDVAQKIIYPACAKTFDLNKILTYIDVEYKRFTARGKSVPHLAEEYPRPL